MENRDEKGQFSQGNKINAYSEEKLVSLLDAYCTHIANGYDKESFGDCNYRTVEKYANQSAVTTEKMGVATARGRFFWETMLLTSITGDEIVFSVPKTDRYPDGHLIIKGRSMNTQTLIYTMKNKYPDTYGTRRRSVNQSTVNVMGLTASKVIGDDKEPTRIRPIPN